LSSLVTILFIGLVLFLLTRAGPGSPARIVLGADATDQQVTVFNHQNGLDLPVLEQYATWLGNVLHGDFGRSFVTGRDVSSEIASTLPITLAVVLLAFVLSVGFGLAIGTWAALRGGGIFDRLSHLGTVAGLSIPAFWLGILLIRFVAVELRWLPPGGYAPLSDGVWAHLQTTLMPAVSLSIYYIAVLSRMTQASLAEVLRTDYIRTANAMGLSRPRVVAYALINALPPIVNLAALSFGYMFGWALIIEQVFNVPGLSRALMNAISQRDFLLLQGIVFLFTVIFMAANLLADIINGVLAPRVQAVS
jgi:peptide/nickel transport system permease protein